MVVSPILCRYGGLPYPLQTYLYLLQIRGQQGQGRKSCRADGESLAGSGSGIAESVQDVGTLTYLRLKIAHLGVSAGVVGYRAVCVSVRSRT